MFGHSSDEKTGANIGEILGANSVENSGENAVKGTGSMHFKIILSSKMLNVIFLFEL